MLTGNFAFLGYRISLHWCSYSALFTSNQTEWKFNLHNKLHSILAMSYYSSVHISFFTNMSEMVDFSDHLKILMYQQTCVLALK